jgi:hypothetical protein
MRPKTGTAAKRESHNTNSNSTEASGKIIQNRRDVFTFAEAIAEASAAFPYSPKIEV